MIWRRCWPQSWWRGCVVELAPLLDREALAKLLGLAPATVKRLAWQKPESLPPRVQNMTQLRWHPADVEAWLRPARRVGRPRAS